MFLWSVVRMISLSNSISAKLCNGNFNWRMKCFEIIFISNFWFVWIIVFFNATGISDSEKTKHSIQNVLFMSRKIWKNWIYDFKNRLKIFFWNVVISELRKSWLKRRNYNRIYRRNHWLINWNLKFWIR